MSIDTPSHPVRSQTGRRAILSGLVSALMCLAWTAIGGAEVAEAGQPEPDVEILPYEIETGDVDTSLDEFAASVEETLEDPRGWSLGGVVEFRRQQDDGLFTVVLASPQEVEAAAPICSADWSCRVGDRVLINEERWLGGTISYPLPLSDYRDYVVNHELGHWLGLNHRDCPSFDAEAPVMMQQSKAIAECRPTVWPIPDEQQLAASLRGVDVRRQQRLELGDRGAGAAEWQQHLNEQAGQDLVVDGWFGPNTAAATAAYERFFGFPVDRVAGANDRSLMNYLLRLEPRHLVEGMRGPDVTDWQRELRQLGLDLVVDGWFGPQTRDRTIDVQRFFGLPVTGGADEQTRNLVDYLLASEE